MSESDPTPKEISANQYRFSGYQLPMIQLDETGPAYIVIEQPHPYYRNQPMDWQKPCYLAHPYGVDSNLPVEQLYPLMFPPLQ